MLESLENLLRALFLGCTQRGVVLYERAYPLIQNDYRQEKIIFELFSGALQETSVRAPGAITGGALTGQGPIQETIFGELFSGALQENPVRAPGQLHEKNVYRIILVIISP